MTDFFQMLYRGALYSNLHTYDFGDAAPSVDNSPGHWRHSLATSSFCSRGGGGGSLSLFQTKGFLKQKSLPVPEDTFALRSNGDF